MALAQALGRRLNRVDAAWADASVALIRRLLPPPPLDGLDADAVLAIMARDKKWARRRQFFVFSTGPGRYGFEEDVPAEAVEAAVREFLAAGSAPPAR
jgi:3-dehydroquinate synthetase